MNRYYRLKRLLKKGVILLMIKEPTEEQAKILSHEGNIVVTARPGSGKTYTVVEKIRIVLEKLPDYKGMP